MMSMDVLIDAYRNTRKNTRKMYQKTEGEDKKKWGQMLRTLDWSIYYMEQGRPPEDFPPFRSFGGTNPTILDEYMQDTAERVGSVQMTPASLWNAVTEEAYDAYLFMSQGLTVTEIAHEMGLTYEEVTELLDKSEYSLKCILEQRST